MKKTKVIIDAFKAAFPHTIPILAGFSFLGLSFGVLMNVSGFSFWYPLVMSIVVFGGRICSRIDAAQPFCSDTNADNVTDDSGKTSFLRTFNA